MPEVDRATVTSAVVATDRVAVSVKDVPAFSAMDVALVASVTVGADSLSVIVIVFDCHPLSVALPPEILLIARVAVSFPS